MSATLEPQQLQTYFHDISTPSQIVPVIKCPFKVYNVVEVYLEDLKDKIGFKVSLATTYKIIHFHSGDDWQPLTGFCYYFKVGDMREKIEKDNPRLHYELVDIVPQILEFCGNQEDLAW